jgi:hypothetical protein
VSDHLRRLAIEQRKRVVGGIMGHVENSPWWPKLAPAEQKAFRDKVLSSVNAYHDLMLDMLRITGDDALVNERTLDVIERVHESQRRLERRIGA